VRDGKGAKDRVTMLPVNLAQTLERQLQKVKTQHEEDLEGGLGSVDLSKPSGRRFRFSVKMIASGVAICDSETLLSTA
jgi:hypothetical protein